MFTIGEQVEYLGEGRGKYVAIVVSSDTQYTRCKFYSTGKDHDPEGKYYGEYSFKTSLFKSLGPPPPVLTPQEKVLKKIKHLDQQFKERQALKAKEKENAKKVDSESQVVSVQNGQRFGLFAVFLDEYIESERARTIRATTRGYSI